MPELNIPVEEILTFGKGKKHSALCRVKHCQSRHAKTRRICSKHHMQVWRRRNPNKAAFDNIRDRANRKKIPFTITFEEFVEIAEATGYVDNRGVRGDQLHLDRADARKGYTVDNVRVITCAENGRKGSYERRIQLHNGHWVMLHEIGVGVPHPDTPEEDDWCDPDTLGEIDWEVYEKNKDDECPF